MYSMIVNKYGSPDNLEYQETKSRDIKSNLIRLDVKAAGVNFADILTIKGRYQERPRPPFSPGLEVSGKIIEIGNKVFNFKVGDHVVFGRTNGRKRPGVIIKTNPARAVIKDTNLGGTWRVPYSLMEAA